MEWEIYQDDDELWHWILWARNGNAMAMNERGYTRKYHCRHAVLGMKAAAGEGSKLAEAPIRICEDAADRRQAA